jgi:hypothetical protein
MHNAPPHARTRRACCRSVASAAALLLTAWPLATPAAQEVVAVTAGEVRMLEAGTLLGTLMLPAGGSPAGLVLLLHDGTLGHDPRGAPYADQLLGAGLAVLELMRGGEDPAAIDQALPELTAQIGPDRLPVGAIGFGGGARTALRLGPAVAARVLLYPGCAGLAEAAGTLPSGSLLLLHGTADPANAEADCVVLAATLQRNAHVRRISYQDAGFAWDYPAYGPTHPVALPRPDGLGLVRALPWPELTEMSASQAAGFLAGAFLASSGAGHTR